MNRGNRSSIVQNAELTPPLPPAIRLLILMEIRQYAEQILLSPDIEQKLRVPTEPLTDDAPGESVRIAEPVRPANLQFAPRREAPQMPALGALEREDKRGLAHHIMANHELQAVEVMAWVILAFPEAPKEYRAGMAAIMRDEQRHTRMHAERAARLGCPFGTYRVNCYIWKKAMAFTSVLDYLAGLPLVLEAANLDHSIELATTFERFGDPKSAALMRQIHKDEIEHVSFGLEWLRKLKPNELSDFEAFEKHLHWPLRAAKARGNEFQREARAQAGMDNDFLDRLEQAAIDDEALEI
ncbi:ferritin-like domain-containing protein [Planctomicrobium sp. SH668]|uniref:ferritin-like domain-containing protein n=1 Tax=Planctomicrobium sp. SH668 TaxID=3448126 RepID=UPI003F5B63C1